MGGGGGYEGSTRVCRAFSRCLGLAGLAPKPQAAGLRAVVEVYVGVCAEIRLLRDLGFRG